jgi:hypothetical protein
MVMLLNGDNGAEFELALIHDRFPELQDGAADSSWLTLSFRVGTQDQSWEETAPCMNIFELQTLQEWLQSVGEGSPDVTEVEVLEPGLRFSVTRQRADSVTVRIDFQLDDRPQEFEVGADTQDAESISLVLSREQIRAAAAELRRDLDAVTSERTFEEIEGENLGIIGVPDEDLGLRPDESNLDGEQADDRQQ